MAHLLNRSTNGNWSFASTEKAWHGLGQIVDKAMTSKEAIELANLDYTVDKRQAYMEINGEYIPVPKKHVTYRTDTNDVFGIVGDRYHIVQNTDAFQFFDAIVGENEAIFETAGCLKKGEVVFITAKLPSYIAVKDDVVDNYLILSSSHDGTRGIQVMFSPIRVVCNNTLSAAYGNSKYRVNITHTKSANEQLRKAHEIMGISNLLTQELSDVYNAMASTRITDNNLEKFIVDSLDLDFDEEGKLSTRATNIVSSIREYYEVGPGQEEFTGTVWGAYNAVTGYFQNVRDYKNNEDKLSQNMFGTLHTKNNNSLRLAMEMI
jgi:phage/plasmid-like protein (TIGR03299 family)